MREHLKCWGCEEPHLLRDCPRQNIQMIMRDREATIVNDIARNIPTISAALENQQAEHQPTMVEMEGKIDDQSVTFLTDLGASLSHISPQVVEKFNLKNKNFQQSWLVQLATGTKRKVTHKLPQTSIKSNDFHT